MWTVRKAGCVCTPHYGDWTGSHQVQCRYNDPKETDMTDAEEIRQALLAEQAAAQRAAEALEATKEAAAAMETGKPPFWQTEGN